MIFFFSSGLAAESEIHHFNCFVLSVFSRLVGTCRQDRSWKHAQSRDIDFKGSLSARGNLIRPQFNNFPGSCLKLQEFNTATWRGFSRPAGKMCRFWREMPREVAATDLGAYKRWLIKQQRVGRIKAAHAHTWRAQRGCKDDSLGLNVVSFIVRRNRLTLSEIIPTPKLSQTWLTQPLGVFFCS